MSPATGWYVLAIEPLISEQPALPVSQRCHCTLNFNAGPSQVPRSAVRVLPSVTAPLIVGAAMIVGACCPGGDRSAFPLALATSATTSPATTAAVE
jgi:hypothetical protein